MEVHDEKTFLSQITDTSLNRNLYQKSLKFDTYYWNGRKYRREILEEKFGNKLDAAIKKYGFRKKAFLTELTYEEFNNKIQNDTISEIRSLNEKKVESKISSTEKSNNPKEIKSESRVAKPSFDYKKDFKNISLLILFIAFPFRWSIYALIWSVRQVKN